MNKNYTEIAFVLDRSGSMESCRDAAIVGFNRFLREQQEVEGIAKLTLVLFDDEYEVPVQSVPVHEVVELTRQTYEPATRRHSLMPSAKPLTNLAPALQKWPKPTGRVR